MAQGQTGRDNDKRFEVRQPRAFGDKTLEEVVKDLVKRVETLESQAGTA